MEDRLRETARRFLERPEAECFIGYERAPTGSVRAAFIRGLDEVGRLVWNQQCYPNLAAHLPHSRGGEKVIGIAVKGCDARALRELIRSRQVDRSKLFVVGLPCKGLTADGGEDVAERCLECVLPEDFHYDEVLGRMEALVAAAPTERDALADLSPEERFAFWAAELEKCILCEACRKTCYGCFCPECIFESSRPRWLSRRGGLSEKLFFHSVRALHLAGRCIGCGECERACPAGVRLDLLNRRLRDDVEALFGGRGAGVSGDPPPLLGFSRDDPDP